MTESWGRVEPLFGAFKIIAEHDTSYPPYRIRAFVYRKYNWDESQEIRKREQLDYSNQVHAHILNFGYRPTQSIWKNPKINFIWFQNQEDASSWFDLVPRAALLMRLTI